MENPDVATLRWQIFPRSQAESENSPPTRGTVVQHTCSAHLQSIYCVIYGWGGQSKPTKSCPVSVNNMSVKMLTVLMEGMILMQRELMMTDNHDIFIE